MRIELSGQETNAAAAVTPAGGEGTESVAMAPTVSPAEVTKWVNEAGTQLLDLTVAYAPRFALALVVLVVGWVVIGVLRRGLQRVLGMKNIDITVGHFLGSLASIAMKVMLLLSVAGMLGIEVTSFIAILSAATLAIGLALKGTLSNFAGGISVLLFRPFKVGDFITGAGQSGSVKAIHIFNTILTTGDNQTVIIPNNAISTGVLVNSSTQTTRRIQIDVGIGYEDDIDQARKVVLDLIAKDARVHAEPAPMVAVGALGASSVDLVIRFWVDAGDFWPAKFDFNENVKKAFDAAGINIPYPQQVIHHANEKGVAAS